MMKINIKRCLIQSGVICERRSEGGLVRMQLRRTGPCVARGHAPLAILAHAVDTRRLVPPAIIVCGFPELDKMQTTSRSEIKNHTVKSYLKSDNTFIPFPSSPIAATTPFYVALTETRSDSIYISNLKIREGVQYQLTSSGHRRQTPQSHSLYP